MKDIAILCRLLLCSLVLAPCAQAGDVTVYAAASLTNVMKVLSASYESQHPVRIKSSFASSSTLAKQIEAGANADIFASADQQWMDYLQAHQLIEASSRKALLGNTLVLVAPTDQAAPVVMRKGQAPALKGYLCMGDPTHVPAGIYGKQALVSLDWWVALAKHMVATEDVRAALAFVQRGECQLGIVYATDAAISDKVVIVGRFPAGSHDPVVYPFALLPKASAEARDFFTYLQGRQAAAVFAKAGFTLLKP